MSLTKVSFSMIEGAVTNVLNFGAVGDGVTDDSAAIQAAINYTYTKPNNVGGFQLGGVVFFPKGRYLVKSTINLPIGITIKGEPSGLAATNNITGFSSGSQIQVSTTLAANAEGFCPAFTLSNGGPITIQDIAINGTLGVTQSCALYVGNGSASVPGLSQGHFSNLRLVGFNSVFAGAKFFDCTFYDCGFESNVYGFRFTTGAFQAVNDLKFVGCIFFGGTSALMQIDVGALVTGVVMTGCIFQDDVGVNMNGFNVLGTLNHVSITGCYFKGASGSSVFSLLSSTASLTDITFNGNTLLETELASLNNFSTGVQVYYLNFTGNDFRNSNFTAVYSVNNVVFSGNIFRGTSVLAATSLNNLIITGNDFSGCSVNPPIVLTDLFTSLSVTGNIFAAAVIGIPTNENSLKTRYLGNVGVADWTVSQAEIVTVNGVSTYSVLNTDIAVQNTVAATLTLPAPASYFGRKLRVSTNFAGAVVSASSNVVPLAGGAAGTAILAATAGKWADLQSNGASWYITASN